MRSAGWLLAPCVTLLCLSNLRAQLPLIPVPFGRTVSSSGIGFAYQRRHLAVGGFTGSISVVDYYGPNPYVLGPYGPVFVGPVAPFGVTTIRSTVSVYGPRPLIVAPSQDDDLKGVDLDLVPPPGRGAAGPPGKAPAPEAGRAAKPEAPAVKPEPKPEPPPQANRKMESGRLLDLGLTAFTDKEYGLAAQRWHQAAVLDPTSARARFLLAQAQFALGKYREAVAAIHEGMDLQANWPDAPFRPRLDLYKGNEQDFTTHLKSLEDALTRSPDNRFLLFLDAYEVWFDGRRAEALRLFGRARAATVDTSYIDQFLKAGAGVVAAR